MKKAISIILNIVSIISAVITLFLAAFCVYDWVMLANTFYAYTIEFWLVVDYYAVGMLIFSGVGLATSIPNLFIKPSEKGKRFAKIMTIAFAIVAVVSAVLYLLPFNF